jgi:hypothetical protein
MELLTTAKLRYKAAPATHLQQNNFGDHGNFKMISVLLEDSTLLPRPTWVKLFP